MPTVTLIGSRLADTGREFVYQGESPDCEGCPYRSQCLNLSVGTRYRITDIREDAQTLDCAVHDTGVRAVEVEPAPVPATVPSKERTREVSGRLPARVRTPSVRATSTVFPTAPISRRNDGSKPCWVSRHTITVHSIVTSPSWSSPRSPSDADLRRAAHSSTAASRVI